jgi:hypothetical protein
MIFYGIYKFQPKVKHYLRNQLSPRSLEFLSFHRYAPNSQKPPWKELAACNVVLGTKGGAAGRNSGEPAALSAREGAEGD